VAALVDLAGVGLDVGGDLSLQRRREHLPGPVPHDLIQHRPSRTAGRIGGHVFLHYLEHGRTFPDQRVNAGP